MGKYTPPHFNNVKRIKNMFSKISCKIVDFKKRSSIFFCWTKNIVKHRSALGHSEKMETARTTKNNATDEKPPPLLCVVS